MTHPACGDHESRTFEYFRQLWQRLLDPGTDRETKLEAVFAEEAAGFELPYAFLSRVDRSTGTQHIESSHGDHPLLQPGESVPLSRSYCRKTVADPDGTVRVSDALAEGWADDPAYETFGLGSYVGSTVENDGVYGTLCFASPEPRDDPITEREAALVELLAQWASYETGLRNGTGGRTGSSVELPSEEVDTLLTALGKRPRRRLLSTLLDRPIERTDEILAAEGDEGLRLELEHNHLPKLDQAGYVEWDRTRDVIERGPRFEAVEPLLEVIDRSVLE